MPAFATDNLPTKRLCLCKNRISVGVMNLTMLFSSCNLLLHCILGININYGLMVILDMIHLQFAIVNHSLLGKEILVDRKLISCTNK